MNHLLYVQALENRYFALRHGESKANVEGILLSDPSTGTTDYGLTEKGRQQVRDSVSMNRILDSGTIIYSSDFARATETAEIARRILQTGHLQLSPRLRERYYGDYEGTSSKNYEIVSIDDAHNPGHANHNVESAMSVLGRTTSLVIELEKRYKGKKILLVSHENPLKILQTGFCKMDPSQHRTLDHLLAAEIRELKLR